MAPGQPKHAPNENTVEPRTVGELIHAIGHPVGSRHRPGHPRLIHPLLP